MNCATKSWSSWTRGRFLAVAGVLFVLQAGLIFLFGDRSQPRPPAAESSIRLRALGALVNEDDLLRQYFVADPSVFALPNYHGFSGRGWLQYKAAAYQDENELEAPSPLPLKRAGLGANFPNSPSGSETTPGGWVEPLAHYEDPLPISITSENLALQSHFRLDGRLSDRFLDVGPPLPSWPSTRILTHSSVQIAVNPAGEVVAARLENSCGLPPADAEALNRARALRFRPAPSSGTQWGEAIFQWQTTEPVELAAPKGK